MQDGECCLILRRCQSKLAKASIHRLDVLAIPTYMHLGSGVELGKLMSMAKEASREIEESGHCSPVTFDKFTHSAHDMTGGMCNAHEDLYVQKNMRKMELCPNMQAVTSKAVHGQQWCCS